MSPTFLGGILLVCLSAHTPDSSSSNGTRTKRGRKARGMNMLLTNAVAYEQSADRDEGRVRVARVAARAQPPPGPRRAPPPRHRVARRPGARDRALALHRL